MGKKSKKKDKLSALISTSTDEESKSVDVIPEAIRGTSNDELGLPLSRKSNDSDSVASILHVSGKIRDTTL